MDGHAAGWSFVPLNGKAPIMRGWQSASRESSETLAAWVARGNVGIRTGPSSGIIIIDQDNGGDVAPLSLPETVTTRTGSGGMHYYFSYSGDDIGNSAGKLGPKIDVRGKGGQAVFPGSIHPDTREKYTWVNSPRNTKIAPLPGNIISLLRGQSRYVGRAVELAERSVATAPEGTRNDALNKAAYSMGGLVANGHLDENVVFGRLSSAGKEAGLHHEEVRKTIESGMSAGKAAPRDIPIMKQSPRVKPSVNDSEEDDTILIPGPHITDNGEYMEISSDAFAKQVLNAMPDDYLYRRDHVPGELLGEPGHKYWNGITENRMLLAIDGNARLGQWCHRKNPKEGQSENFLVYRPCNKTLAGLVIAQAQGSPYVREIKTITPYPVYCPGFVLSPPGYHSGVYYDEPAELSAMKPITDLGIIYNVLHDLVVDFPFRSEADRQNFFGLMLTPIISPALEGNRPLHMLISPLERTGKTKLAEEILGGVILGTQTPAMQLPDRDEERDKRVIGILMQGGTLLHLDNLPPKIDSASLASLLTATNYSGRILGVNTIISLQNNLTIVASGNNIEVTGEIAKRTIPICLQPATESPEMRNKFNHPNVREFVRKSRVTVLRCLLGMVDNWLDAGRPRPDIVLGGFEAWSHTVGGILQLNGMTEWRKNEGDWRAMASSEAPDLSILVDTWLAKYGFGEVTQARIRGMCEESGVFTDYLSGMSERAVSVKFGKMLNRLHGMPAGGKVISRRRDRTGMVYFLSESK